MSPQGKARLVAFWRATGSLYTAPEIEGMVRDVRSDVEAALGPFRPAVGPRLEVVPQGEPEDAEDDGDAYLLRRAVTDGASYKEIGDALGVSAGRAWQIEQRALRKMRRAWLAAYGDPFPSRRAHEAPEQPVDGDGEMVWSALTTMCGAYALAAE